MKDLELIPTIEIWRMAAADPENDYLKLAVEARERDYQQRKRQNHADSCSAAYRREEIARLKRISK